MSDQIAKPRFNGPIKGSKNRLHCEESSSLRSVSEPHGSRPWHGRQDAGPTRAKTTRADPD